MKTTFLSAMLAFLPISAVAETQLLVETTATEYFYTDGVEQPTGSKVLFHSSVLTTSDKVTIVQGDRFKCAVTPTLHEDGTIGLAQSVTRLMGKGSPKEFGPFTSIVKTGEAYGPTIGLVEFATTVSLVK